MHKTMTVYDLYKQHRGEFFHKTPVDEEGQQYEERNYNVEITVASDLRDNAQNIEYRGCQVYGVYINDHDLHELIIDTPDGTTHFVEVPYTCRVAVTVS